MPSSPASRNRFTLLVVCTGNLCRSPIAERLGGAYLTDVLGEGYESTFRIVSAGTQAVAGYEMDADSALVLRGLGGDPDRFWAQQVSAELATSADLILTMTAQHRDDVFALAPRGLARTFTVLEAADLVAGLDDTDAGRAGADGDTLPERARGVVRAMAAARAGRRVSPRDDIPDPIGRQLKAHQEVGETIADAMLVVLGRLVGVRDAASQAAGNGAYRRARHRVNR